MTDLRRTVYGVAIVIAVTLAAHSVGRARRESHNPQNAVQIARFTRIEGKVQYKRVGTFQWIDATLAVRLLDGDLVRSGKSAAARIRFPDGTYFTIPPDKLISISIPGPDTEGPRAPRPHPLPTDVALLAARDLAPLALPLALVGGLALVASRITQKRRWRREFRRRREAAEQGDPFAQLWVGFAYRLANDPVEAVRWFRMAADQGLPDAAQALGDAYDNCEGVMRDEEAAAGWYYRAGLGWATRGQLEKALLCVEQIRELQTGCSGRLAEELTAVVSGSPSRQTKAN